MSWWYRLTAPVKKLSEGVEWIKSNLSSSGSASNSRTLQTLIVFNLLIMMWIVLAKAAWVISDNSRLILLCLITGGAGAYVAGKLGGDKHDP